MNSHQLTLTLEQAAEELHVHPETLRTAAVAGRIPAARPFGRWLFIPADLQEWVRQGYPVGTSTTETGSWENMTPTGASSVARTAASITSTLPAQTAREYDALLGRKTSAKRGSTETKRNRQPGDPASLV